MDFARAPSADQSRFLRSKLDQVGYERIFGRNHRRTVEDPQRSVDKVCASKMDRCATHVMGRKPRNNTFGGQGILLAGSFRREYGAAIWRRRQSIPTAATTNHGTSNDISTFAWAGVADESFGMLAASPVCFAVDEDYKCFRPYDTGYTLSKECIHGAFFLWRYSFDSYVLEIGALVPGASRGMLPSYWSRVGIRVGIYVQQRLDDSYVRVIVDGKWLTRRDRFGRRQVPVPGRKGSIYRGPP